MKTRLLLIITIACFGYAGYSFYKLVVLDPAPFTLRSIGVRLDPHTIFAISNDKSTERLRIDYPQGKGLLPGYLGTIKYDPDHSSFSLTTSREIIKEDQSSKSPFYAFARSNTGDYTRFGPEDIVGPHILETTGVIFNSPAGDRGSRVTLKIEDFNGKKFLNAKSEGLGVEYKLEAANKNSFAVLCNTPPSITATRIFSFTNTAEEDCSFRIEAESDSFLRVRYAIYDRNGSAIATGNEWNSRFEVGRHLFELESRFSRYEILLLLLTGLLIFWAQVEYVIRIQLAQSPPERSVFAVRMLLNCLALLATPLYLHSLNYTNGRSWYLVMLAILNIWDMRAPFFLALKLGYDVRRFTNVILGCAKRILTNLRITIPLSIFVVSSAGVLVVFMSANEAVWGVPVLHVQKLGSVALIFLTYHFTRLFPATAYGQILRGALVFVYAILMSLGSSDIGSGMYAVLSLALIAFLHRPTWLKPFLIVSGLATLIGIGAYYAFQGSFVEGKFYRVYAPYTSPESPYLRNVNESDRQTFANAHLIQKKLSQGEVPAIDKVVVPLSMRSTSFSDYAFFWSLVFGKSTFGILFLLVLGVLLYELLFLLLLTIRPIIINNSTGTAFYLPVTPESDFLKFLLALTIVTLVYPVLSNLMVAPLTGQSLPLLAISVYDVFFLLLLIVPITFIFSGNRYEATSDDSVGESYGNLRMRLRWLLLIAAIIFLTCTSFRYVWLQRLPDDLRWSNTTKPSDTTLNNDNVADKKALTEKATKLVGTHQLTNIPRGLKPQLRDLFSYYYEGVPFSKIRIENPRFELTSAGLLRRMDISTAFNLQPRRIDGSQAPFGRVFAYSRLVNGRSETAYSNSNYWTLVPNSNTLEPDLTAELTKALQDHLKKIGVASNSGSILVINNATGAIVANSSAPVLADVNANETHYFIGSLKKIVLAYAALKLDPSYKTRRFNRITMQEFIRRSDDVFAAELLRDIMQQHETNFGYVLEEDFGLPLISQTHDAFFDQKPEPGTYKRGLDKNNSLYRYSIGQEKPYRFIDVIEWFARIASEKKIEISTNHKVKDFEPISLDAEEMTFLKDSMRSVLFGTARNLGAALEANGLRRDEYFGKTGTAESESGSSNTSSSIIISNQQYTIGIMLKGRIPANKEGLSAQNLMISSIPTLKKYSIL